MKHALLGLFVLAACAESPVQTEAVAPDPTVEQAEAPLAFVVHEWGTYTSVQSSLGQTLEGLHHEEEVLPGFVHGRAAISRGNKQLESLPEPVTQKLETPVLYFYGNGSVPQAQVKVGFPKGVIGQWYPKATSFLPAVGELAGIRDGHMTWDVRFPEGETPTFPPVDPHDVWAPSRRVAALPLMVGDEAEKFIFYRGLGRFEMPIRVFTGDDGTLQITNDSDDPIGAYFVLHVHAGGGAIRRGSVEAGATALLALPGTPKERSIDAYVADAGNAVHAALVESGLFDDEARAMVDTWSHSYFRTPGLRVLYIAPSAWADRLLPLEITPQPDAIVRTFVGRIEVLTRPEERSIVDALHAHAEDGAALDLGHLGRFAEPKLRRALELIDDPMVAAAAHRLLREAHDLP